MALSLGSASASITLDIGSFVGNAAKAQSVINQLGNSGGNGFARTGKAIDGMGASAKGAAGSMNVLGTATDNAGKKQAGFWRQTASMAGGFVAGGLILAGIGQINNMGKAWLGAGLSFEQGMANVQAVTGATGDEFKQLQDLALKIGKDTIFGANEATQAIEELAKAGVSVENILSGAADGATALAAAGGVALPEAASVMSAALNLFELDGTQAVHVADLLAAAAATSATGVSELGESLKYVGGTAHAMGIPIEDVITALAILGDNGLQGSVAGTALNAALTSLIRPSETAQKELDKLGVSAVDVNGNFKPLPQILSELNTSLEALPDGEKLRVLDAIFGTEGAKAILPLLNAQTEGAEKAGKAWADYYKSVNQDGAAAEQAAARMNSTMGAIEGLKGSLETFAIITSMAVLPAFRGLIEGASGVVDGVSGFITSMQSYMSHGESFFTAFSLSARTALYNMFGVDGMNAIMPFVDGALDGLEVLISGIQAVAGVVGDALGSVFSFLADHIGTITQVILPAVAAFFALNKAIAAVNAISTAAPAAMAGIKSALLGMNPWVLAAAVAIGLLAAAWKNNWFDIQGKTKSAWKKIKPQLGEMREGLDTLINGSWAQKANVMKSALGHVANGVDALGKRFPALAKPLGLVSEGMRALPGLASGVTRQFKTFLAQGMNPVAAGFATMGIGFQKLANQFPAFSGFFSGMRDQMIGFGAASTSAIDGFRKLFGGDVRGAMSSFRDAATQMWDNVKNGAQTVATGMQELASVVGNALGSIDWSGVASGAMSIGSSILSGLGDIAGQIGSWVSQQFTAIKWDEVGSTVSTKVSEMLGTVFAVGKDLGEGALAISEQVGSWLQGQFEAIPWETVGESLKTNFSTMLDGVFAIGEDLGATALDVGEQVGAWVKGQFESVDWESVGATLKTKFGEAMAGAFATGQDIGSVIGAGIDIGAQILGWITDQIVNVKWENVGQAFGNLLGNAIKGAVVGTVALAGLAGQLLGGILNSLADVDWNAVSDTIGQFLKAAVLAAKDFLVGAAKGLWTGLTSGLEGQIATAANAIKGMLNDIIGQINDLIDGLNQLPGVNIPKIGLIIDSKPMYEAGQDAAKAVQTVAKASGNAAELAIATLQSKGIAAATMVGQSVVKALQGIQDSWKKDIGPNEPGGSKEQRLAGGKIAFDAEDNVTPIINRIRDAVHTMPKTATTTFSAAGAEAVTASANAATAAINAMPDEKRVSIVIEMAGGAAAGSTINAANNALAAMQNVTVKYTADTAEADSAYSRISGLADVTKGLTVTGDASEAQGAWDGINGLADVTKSLTITGDNSGAMGAYNELSGLADITKTMTINIVVNGSVPDEANANGGMIGYHGKKTTISRLGERGPELFRTPRGTWGLARTDGLYPMVPGSYVYTASRTKNMLRKWDGPSYASGGRVAMPTASSQRGTTTVVSNEYRVAPNITVNPQSTLTDRELDHVMEQVSGAVVTAVQTKRLAKGGQ